MRTLEAKPSHLSTPPAGAPCRRPYLMMTLEDLVAASPSATAAASAASTTLAKAPSGPWIASDTWFALGGASSYFNVRTGTVSAVPPDGVCDSPRADGRRRRSAADTGPWAVPFASPPEELPFELAPRDNAGDDMLQPEVSLWGTRSMLFTAVHGVNLARDEKPEHLPEDFTTYLARAWASRAEGVSASWGLRALEWCERHEAPLPNARDPNYLTFEEAAANAFVVAMETLRPSQREVHVDVHGKADREGEADCDVGVGALRATRGDHAADDVAATVTRALQAALGASFTVDSRPRLQGCWRSVPRRTLTQSSALLGYAVPLQLELGYSLRRALGRDRALSTRVADAFVACAPLCVAAARRVAR